MAKKINDFLKSKTQRQAYSASKKTLAKELTALAKATIHQEVDKKKGFSSFRILTAIPLAKAKQAMFRNGWETVISDAVHKDAPKPTGRPYRKLMRQYVAGSLVSGMAVGAALGFALVGGAVPIAALYGGLGVAALVTGVNVRTLQTHRSELLKTQRLGDAAATKSGFVSDLRNEKRAAEVVAGKEAEALLKAQEQEVERLNELAQQEEAARLQQEEAARLQQEEAARLQQEEAARLQQEEAARFQQEEAARLQQEEAARLQQEEAARLQQEEAARLQQEEAARLQQEEAARFQQEELSQLQSEVERDAAEIAMHEQEIDRLYQEMNKKIEARKSKKSFVQAEEELREQNSSMSVA